MRFDPPYVASLLLATSVVSHGGRSSGRVGKGVKMGGYDSSLLLLFSMRTNSWMDWSTEALGDPFARLL